MAQSLCLWSANKLSTKKKDLITTRKDVLSAEKQRNSKEVAQTAAVEVAPVGAGKIIKTEWQCQLAYYLMPPAASN